MARQDLTLALTYDDAEHDVPLFSVRAPVVAKWGVSDEGSALGVATCAAQIDNRSGDYDPSDVRSSLYGSIGPNTPATIMLGPELLADGSVAAWSPDAEIKGPAWTDIVITGPARRVNASKDVRSATKRTLAAATARGEGPAAYWPLEDGPNTILTESAVEGVPGMVVYDFANSAAGDTYVTGQLKFGEGKAPPGSRPIVDLSGGGSLRVILPDTDPDLTFWKVAWTSTFPLNGADGSSPGSMLRIISDSGDVSYIETDAGPGWRMFYSPDGVNTVGRGITAGVGLATAAPYDDGLPHTFELKAVQSGGDVSLQMRYDGNLVGISGDFSDDGLPAATLGRILSIEINSANPEGGAFMPSIGQVQIWYGPTEFESAVEITDMLQGYPGEGAEDRFARLCDEHNVPYNIRSEGDAQHLMGPQYADTLAELLREIRDTDGGLIYDARDYNELEFRPGRTLWNQVPALALTWDVNVSPPLRPATDDLNLTNDVTVNQREGATLRVTRDTGPNNTQDPADDPEGVTRQESRIEANPSSSATLADIAGAALHVGTWPGARYRQVSVDLSKHPDLIPDVMALRPGDVLSVDELAADTIELMVLGGVDTVGPDTRKIVFNCRPAGPYRSAVVGVTGSNRLSAADTTIIDPGGLDTTETGADIRSAAVRWIDSATYPSSFPFDAVVGGERMTVTALTLTALDQVATVTRSVNGVVRSHALGAKFNLFAPIYVAP